MKHKRGGRKGGKPSRGSLSGGRARSRGGRGGRGRRSDNQVYDDINLFARRQELSEDFISLRDARNSQIKLNKNMKTAKLQQVNEIIDSNRGDFSNADEMALNSIMFQTPRRRKRNENSMFNEVRYTNSHREDIFKRSYRKLTIEFVKAKDTYDPSKELIAKLAKKNNVKVSEYKEVIDRPNIVDIAEQLILSNEIEQRLAEDLQAYDDEDGSEGKQDYTQIDYNFDDNLDEAIHESVSNSQVIELSDYDRLENTNYDNLLMDEQHKQHKQHEAIEEGKENEDEQNEDEQNEDEQNEDEQNEDEQNEDEQNEDEQNDTRMKAEKITSLHKPTVEFSRIKTPIKKSELLFVDDNNNEEFNISYYEDDEDDDGEIESDYARAIYMDSDLDDLIEDNLEVNVDEVLDYKNYDADSDNEFQLGKFLGKMKKTKNGENYIELPSLSKKKKSTSLPTQKVVMSEKMLYSYDTENDDMTIDDVVKHVNKKMYGDSIEVNVAESEQVSDVEFGFMEEDYVSFDTTQIKIENIRVGTSEEHQQFYVQAPMIFGFDDFQWLNKSDLADFLAENGLPEHRFNAFIRSATTHLTHPQTLEEADDFDEDELFISDSSDEDEDEDASVFRIQDSKKRAKLTVAPKNKALHDDYDSDDLLLNDSELDEELMEGMDELLKMHNLSKNNNYDALEVNTKTVRVKGKNKKLGLEFNTEVDPDFQKYLHEKYISQKNKRKDNKEERELARKNNAYMLVRYPYLMEMQDIIDEFKDFFKDSLRESLRFPPMDPHVHIVLKSISEAFGFPSKKIGKGIKQYVEVRKPHKSRSRHPDWNRIDKMAKKRNICFRMDVKLSREEKRELKRMKGGDAAVEKMRNKGRGNFGYKESEIVGATAKEIDSESIGRKLLEKMGWHMGEALGPDSNKGIVEPIKVVFKTSKRGIM